MEQSPVFLLGLVLVFFGRRQPRLSWELPLLAGLSWLTLFIGLLFFLMIPFGISRTGQLQLQQQQYQLLANIRVDQQLSRVQTFQVQVDQATATQIPALLERLSVQYGTLEIEPTQDLSDIKEELRSRLTQSANEIKVNAKTAQVNQRQTLLKQSIKWNLGALISGTLLMGLWKGTGWARQRS